ncbi:MAG: hypothetical protein ACM3PR_13190 [Bacteroidales bacterium]
MKELTEEELLAIIQSWENLALVVRHINDHPEHLEALMKLSFDDSEDRNWRAAWMVDKIHEKHPELIIPYLPVMIDFVFTTRNAGKKRHLLKLISLHEIPQEKMGELLNFCIDTFTSAAEPIAVRAHAMQVLYQIALKEPDFAGELIELIRQEMEHHGSAGIKARGRKIIQKLTRLSLPSAGTGGKRRKS